MSKQKPKPKGKPKAEKKWRPTDSGPTGIDIQLNTPTKPQPIKRQVIV